MRLIPGKTKVKIELFKHITIADIIVGLLGFVVVTICAISSLPGRWIIASVVAAIFALLLFRLDDEPIYIFLWDMLKYFSYPRRFVRIYDDQAIKNISNGSRQRILDDFFDDTSEPGTATAQVTDEGGEEETSADNETLETEQFSSVETDSNDYADEDALVGPADGESFNEIDEETYEESDEESSDLRLQESEQDEDESVADILDRQDQEKLEAKENKRQEKEEKKRLKQLIKEENKILKSKTATPEEKDAVWAARAERSAAKKKSKAENKEEDATFEEMSDFIAFTGIDDGFIEYAGKYYGSVIEIDPIEFRFFSEHRRNNSIESCLGKILRGLMGDYGANIVKIQRPIIYDKYLDAEYDKLDALRKSYESGLITEEELQARVEIQYDRINEVRLLCEDDKVIDPFYYLVLFESDKGRLETFTNQAMMSLEQGELTVRRLYGRDLAIFLKYTNKLDFDEREIDEIDEEQWVNWAMPEDVKFTMRTAVVDGFVTHNMRVISYPTMVGDSWLAGVMSFPSTKVVVKITPMDRGKSIRAIDRSLAELRGQYMATSIDSKMLELQEHINTLSSLLVTLQQDNEALLSVNIYITAYDAYTTANDPMLGKDFNTMMPYVADIKKTLKRNWSEEGMKLSGMDFLQIQSFIGSQISAYDPLLKDARGIPANTIAGMFPWIYAHISDVGGIQLGSADGVPVFIDFFKRNDERVNSNMVIVGKSGSGKSYATKSLLTNLASEDAKIFILDPENEYSELAHTLHGKVINVGNAKFGRLNPFHIITALDDDEAGGDDGPSGSFATHLQFLEEFFRQILPDVDKEALEYLNSLVERVYLNFGITPDTDISGFTADDYPIFDDLYDVILAEFERTNNEYLRNLLRSLVNYISKFSTGGRNANIWNGPSTVTTEENFSVFNFQSMLANRNSTIANAQMLLVLKYIDNEIIKNRDYNTKYGLNRKIVVVIDEAHVFIDTKFPVALDFMFQLAKRIRKYNGMQIVITQNIKDFVGSEDIARKSSAIINACQYSFVFGLSPNDMSDLCKLYEKAGGINESEQEDILQAKRGQAFTIMSPTSRSSFMIEVPDSFVDMFENSNFISNYFTGEEGGYAWEDFVEDSREIHHENYVSRKALEQNVESTRNAKKDSLGTLSFSEISTEEAEELSKRPSAVDKMIAAEEFVNQKELEILTGRFGNINLQEVDEPEEDDSVSEDTSDDFSYSTEDSYDESSYTREDSYDENSYTREESNESEEDSYEDSYESEDSYASDVSDQSEEYSESDEDYSFTSEASYEESESVSEENSDEPEDDYDIELSDAVTKPSTAYDEIEHVERAVERESVAARNAAPAYAKDTKASSSSRNAGAAKAGYGSDRLYTREELDKTIDSIRESIREELARDLEDKLKWIALGANAAVGAAGGAGVAGVAGGVGVATTVVQGKVKKSEVSEESEEEESFASEEDSFYSEEEESSFNSEEEESFVSEESVFEDDEDFDEDEFYIPDDDDEDDIFIPDDDEEDDDDYLSEDEEDFDFDSESEEYEPAPFLFAELLAEAADEYASMDLEERMDEMNEQVLEVSVEELGEYIKKMKKKK